MLARFQQYVEHVKRQGEAELTNSLERLATEAKAAAPVASGTLRDSITVVKDGNRSGYVFVAAAYAIYVEYGTGRTKPQPFLRPAYQLERYAFLNRLKAAINSGF